MREKINGQSEGGHARVTEGDPRVGGKIKGDDLLWKPLKETPKR